MKYRLTFLSAALAVTAACTPLDYPYIGVGGPGPGPGPGSNYITSAAIRPHIHLIVPLDNGLIVVKYVPGRITETEIVASLQPQCALSGKNAYRAEGVTTQETLQDRQGRPITVNVFTVVCA